MSRKRHFLSALGALALPIIVQSLLSQAIGAADTLMLSTVGQDQLSAVSLANQLFFVLSLFFAGLTGSTAIMLSQYMGKKDDVRVQRIFSMACVVSEGVCVLFALAAIFAAPVVMRLLTSEAVLVQEGCAYLRIVGISYLFMGMSQIYLVMLKARQESHRSMAIGVMTLVLNLILNAVFIFGLFGTPKLGTRGVALATCIARAVELLVCVADMKLRKLRVLCTRFEIPLFKDFVRICGPLTIQGFVWGGAMAMISAIMGHLGSDIVAAHAVAAVVQNIATVASFGLAEAGSILLGKALGEGEYERAKEESRLLVIAAVILGVIGCVVMLLCEGVVTDAVTLTSQAKYFLGVMYKILSVNAVFAAITYTMLCGIFPAGGDTRYGLVLDGCVMWSLVALGSISAFVLKVNPIIVFVVLSVDELLKTPLVLLRYRKGTWIRNITRE